MSPRVLYLEGNEDGTVGGSHRQLFDLIRCLDRSRVEPVVVFYQDNVYGERLRAIGCEVHVFADVRKRERAVHATGGKLAKVREIFRAVLVRRRFLKDHAIDLVHVNNSPRVGNDSWLPACRMVGIPIVASAMGDADGARGRIQSFLFRSFDMVLPVSFHIEAAMKRCGIPSERLTLIHHGVDLEQLRARVTRDPQSVRGEFGLTDDDVLVAMVGNVREWKGQHVVVEALSHLDPDVLGRMILLFVGAVRPEDEDYAAGLRRRVADIGAEGSVVWTGNRDDVPDIFNAADIAVHSSVMAEPGGIVVMEALALGAAVIAAAEGGHNDLLTPQNGRNFDTNKPEQLAERLTELVVDEELRRSLARQAKFDIEAYSIQNYTDAVTAVYDRLL